jgi:hypothetical protein
MTTAHYDLQRMWGIAYDNDSVVSLLVDISSFLQRSAIQKMIPYIGSTGTSGSAQAIEYYLPDMFEKVDYWQLASLRRSEEYQEEVVVLMPPKKQHTVDLEISYVGRAKPLVIIDEMDMELGVD